MQVKYKYLIAGIVFGCMFPIGAYVFEGIMSSEWNIVTIHLNNTLMFMIDSAPIFLGIFAYIGGLYQEKANKNHERAEKLLADLKSTVDNLELNKELLEANKQEIVTISNGLSENVVDINSFFKQMNDDLKTLDVDILEMSNSSEAMFNSAKIISKTSDNINKVSEETNLLNNQLLMSINHFSDDLKEILLSLENEIKSIEVLEEGMTEIEGLKISIENITDEIELLALNASIEASRAGEQGKGFAVVANEVKKLALDSNEVTEQIDVKISHLSSNTQSILKAVSKIEKQLDGVDKTLLKLIEQFNVYNANRNEESKQITTVIELSNTQKLTFEILKEALDDVVTKNNIIKEAVTNSQAIIDFNTEHINHLNDLAKTE